MCMSEYCLKTDSTFLPIDATAYICLFLITTLIFHNQY